jgi:integrase
MGRGDARTPMRRPPQYVHGFLDRHGTPRFYFRRRGFKQIPLPGLPWSPDFMRAYGAALGNQPLPLDIGADRTKPGTVSDAVVRYLRSGTFHDLKPTTQAERRWLLERLRRDHGDKRMKMLQPQHVTALLGKLRPFAQRNMLNALRALCTFALTERIIEIDPTAGFKLKLPKDREGFKTWTPEHIETYRQHHKVGTRARLALELLLNVGARRSDTVKLGRQHVRNGEFTFRTQKTGTLVEGLPMLPELQAALAGMPKSDALTYLMTDFGKPYTSAGFGNWFRARCDEAGIPKGYTAHGLRKASATRLAEEGATPHQLMAWFGWTTLSEPLRYTRAANNKKLARSAGQLISRTSSGKP